MPEQCRRAVLARRRTYHALDMAGSFQCGCGIPGVLIQDGLSNGAEPALRIPESICFDVLDPFYGGGGLQGEAKKFAIYDERR